MTTNAAANNITTSNIRKWLASLTLEFSASPFGTQLTRTKRQGPLSVQKAFYPEGKACAHVYLLHPPAGIVSGDELQIAIDIKTAAHVLVTNPGANRFYRAREDATIGDSKQTQLTTLTLADRAICENFPQETIVYEGADGFNTVDINLTNGSVYLGWDITCLGLPRSDQLFVNGRYCQLNRIFCDDKLIYHDRIAIAPANNVLHHPAGLASNSVFATFVVYAPAKLSAHQRKSLVETLRATVYQQQAQDSISISDINGLLVIRYLGHHAEQCKALFIELWHELRPLCIDKTALEPRIWHT